jgi:CDP-6-deoxy-D-xylo-4-hexulose-3-dehydrase
LESKKIQTRNYFAGNLLLHPGFSHLGNFEEYPEANKVLDKVFFVGAAPHYTEQVFEYIEKVISEYE